MARSDYLVFISHSSKDRWIARQIARLVEEQGIRTFLDEKDIEGGEAIHDTLKKGIRDCNEFLVLLSPYSVQSDWVKIEIGAAWILDKQVVPIVDKVSPDQMPDILFQIKAIDLNDLDVFLEELVNRAVTKP